MHSQLLSLSTVCISALVALAPLVSRASELAPGTMTTVAVEAVYSLPFDESLSPVLNYQLEQAKWFVGDDGKEYFDYELPEDLMGRDGDRMGMFTKTPVDPASPFFQLHCGRTGSEATCARNASHTVCSIVFRDLGINAGDIPTFLDRKYGAADSLRQLRLSAAFAFGGDAIGTIVIERK